MKRFLISLTLLAACAAAYAQEDERADLGYGASVAPDETSAAVSFLDGARIEGSTQRQVLNTLYGLLPGLQVYQNGSGYLPADITPVLTVRGKGSYSGNNVLVLVDGIVRDASEVETSEVAGVTVLKDAVSLARYGIRGADGAVLITTRRGGKEPFRLKASLRTGLQTPVGVPRMAGPVAFAGALNEARSLDGLAPYYSASDISSIAAGTNTIIPTTDWQGLMLKKLGTTGDISLSIDGSTKSTRYYIYADYSSNRGFLRNTRLTEDINTQSEFYSLKLRSNLDIDITPTTELAIGLSGRLQQLQGPQGEMDLTAMYAAPTVGIPLRYDNMWVRTNLYDNPVGSILGTGSRADFGRSLSGDITLRQSFDMLLKGLKAEVRVAYDNSAIICDRKSFTYSYLQVSPLYDGAGNLTDYSLAQYGNDTEIAFATWLSSQYMRFTAWAKIGWDRTFGRHSISTALVAQRDGYKLTGAGNSFKHYDFIYSLDYSFAGRYLFSLTLDESASSLLTQGDKFRFYPAASVGWVVSREPFLQGASWLEFLKLRASAGLVGMDANLVYDMDKQFNGAGKDYVFVLGTTQHGAREGDLPSVGVRPETDLKMNVGMDFRFPFGIYGQADLFRNRRTGLRTVAGNAVSGVLGIGLSDAFTGGVTNSGAELALGWKHSFGAVEVDLGATASFVRSRIDHIEEEYSPAAYQYQKGGSTDRYFALVGDGFYSASDFDGTGALKAGIPVSTFGNVVPGDIKYKDLNEDGRIDNYDYTWLPVPTLPELYYGFRIGLSWKGLGFDAIFQGIGDRTVVTNLASIYQPLYGGDKNVSEHYLAGRWTPDAVSPRYPRLTTLENNNNFRDSDVWTENGKYLKLRELELFYDLPSRWIDSIRLQKARIFVRANNLFSIDSVGIFDPEYIELGYPRAKSFLLGLSVQF